MEREFFLQRFARCGVGLVFIRGCDRPSWRHQLALAAVRSCESIAVGGRTLPRHNAFDQNAKEQISLRNPGSTLLHVCGYVFGWLSKSFLRGPKAGFFERRAIAFKSGRSDQRSTQGRQLGAAGSYLAIRRVCGGFLSCPRAPDRCGFGKAMVAIIAWNQARRFARKRIRATQRSVVTLFV